MACLICVRRQQRQQIQKKQKEHQTWTSRTQGVSGAKKVGAEPCGPSPRRPDKRTRCSTWGSRDGRAFRRGVRRFPLGSCAQAAIRATVVRLFGLCFGFCAPPIRTAHIAQSPVAVRSAPGPLPPRNYPGAGRGGTEQPPGRRRNPRGSAGTGTERVRTPYGLPTGYRRGRSPSSSPVPSIFVHLSSLTLDFSSRIRYTRSPVPPHALSIR
jgi:hypothetical protein